MAKRRTATERLAEEKAKTDISAMRLRRKRDQKHIQYLNKNLKITKDRKTGVRTPDDPSRDYNNTDRNATLALSRQFVEENPLAYALLLTNLNFVVGGGFKLSVQTEDKDLNREIEKRFNRDSQDFDIRGLRDFHGLLRMWQARKAVDGDVFINPMPTDDSLKIATYEGDRCYKKDDRNSCGIDYSSKTGAPAKYHFGPYTTSKTEKNASYFTKPSKDIIPFFHFPQERTSRRRGVGYYLQLLNLLRDIDENMGSMDMKLKGEAFMGIMFTRENMGTALFETDYEDEETNRPLVKLSHGLNLEMLPGEKAELLESKNPHGNYVDYLRFRMRMAGLPFGAPLEFVFMDTKETNYSGMQVLGQLFKKTLVPQQDALKNICSKVFKAWLNAAGLYTDDIFYSHEWSAPSVGLLNILTEANALEKLIGLKVFSRQDALDYMGSPKDTDDLFTDIADEQKHMDELGITYALGDPGAIIANVDENDQTSTQE